MLGLIYGSYSPVWAQSATFEPVDDFSAPRSKFADVDIVTNSPTLLNQSAAPQGQVNSFGASAPSGPYTYSSSSVQSNILPGGSPLNSAQNNVVSQQAPLQSAAQVKPVQIDSQAVGRVVGVAGTAILLGAFLKNGGVGGMMNTLGLDNRFHGRAPSLSSY